MVEPWFNPAACAWIPGTLYGASLVLLVALTGVLVALGRGRRFTLAAWGLALVMAALLLAFGVTAYATGQPFGIWFGLGLPGALGFVLCPIVILMVRLFYRLSEEYRTRPPAARRHGPPAS